MQAISAAALPKRFLFGHFFPIPSQPRLSGHRKPIGRSLIVFTAPCVAVLMVVRRLSPGARARFSAKVPHGSLCHASLFAINLAMR